MIRFILRQTTQDVPGGISERYFTIDAEIPELEQVLTYGGSDYEHDRFNIVNLVGAGVLNVVEEAEHE